jgi:hypothetical protein
MKRITDSHRPRKRHDRLIVDDLSPEVLVYDLDRHKAHCLNETAALVWRACDGRATPAGIAARLTRQLKTPVKEELVWMALRQLDHLNLLEDKLSLPPAPARISRRAIVRNLTIAAAVTVPVVTSIISPTAVQASTCTASGQPCSTSAQCCSGVCTGTPLTCL